MAKEVRSKFWLVWNPQGRSPTHRHLSKESAVREAERLGRFNPGQDFFVLKTTAAVVASEPKIQHAKIVGPLDGGIPF